MATENNTALITLEQVKKDVLFTTPGEIDKALAIVRGALDEFKPDVESESGRKEIASMAFKVSRSKTFLESFKKEFVADAKKKIDSANLIWKPAEKQLDQWRDETRKPLTEWETAESIRQAEEDRLKKEKTQARVDELFKYGVSQPFATIEMLPDEMYEKVLSKAKTEWEAGQVQKKKDEDARAAETKRLVDQKAELDRIAAKQKIAQDKIDAANAKIVKDKAKEDARIAAKKAADDKLIQDAKDKKEAEQRAVAEAERLEVLKPDIDKIYDYTGKLRTIVIPNVKSHEARKLLLWAIEEVVLLAEQIEIKSNDLCPDIEAPAPEVAVEDKIDYSDI